MYIRNSYLFVFFLVFSVVVFIQYGGGKKEAVISSESPQDQLMKVIKLLQFQVDTLNEGVLQSDLNYKMMLARLSSVEKKMSAESSLAPEDFEEMSENAVTPDVTDSKDFLKAIQNKNTVVSVHPTEEQNRIFYDLKSSLDDPNYVQGISMQKLINTDEMKLLPQVLQYVILSKAVERYNNGEIARDVFYSTTN